MLSAEMYAECNKLLSEYCDRDYKYHVVSTSPVVIQGRPNYDHIIEGAINYFRNEKKLPWPEGQQPAKEG